MEVICVLGKLDDRRSALVVKDGQTTKYVVCSYYDPTKPEGSQWCWGHYFFEFAPFVEYVAKEMALAEPEVSLDAACKVIAEWMTMQACDNTESGSWLVYAEEIAKQFKVTEEWVEINSAKIIDAFDYDKVAEAEYLADEKAFDMTMWLEWCPNIDE